MNQNVIGEFIQLSRKEKGLTQKQLADQINVSDKTISKWENGLSTPDTTILLDLCAALDISVNELVSGKKILPEDYSRKAEENIMNLWQENMDSKKMPIFQYVLGAILAVGAIGICLGILQTSLEWYIDLPSIVLPASICMAVLLLAGKKSRTVKIKILRKAVIPSGLVSCLSGVVAIMGNLGNAENLGHNIGVCVLSLLYTSIAYCIILVVEAHME